MSCRNYDPCLDSKLNQIGSYASVARQSAQSATASAAAAAEDAAEAAESAANSANSASEANNYLTQVTNLFEDFDERYLGAKSVAPTVDNQGNPLQEGALYWNSVTDALYVWDGAMWAALPSGFDELTNFIATGTTTARNLVTRFADVINVKDFGAIGDGVSDDTAAIQAAIDSLNDNGIVFFPEGKYVCTTELLILKAGISLIGAGKGYYRWHFQNPLKDIAATTILFKGTGTKSIKTRRLYRSSAADVNDSPISTAINIQNDGVTIKDLTIELYCDYSNTSPTNFGDNWDVGIFHGSRLDLRIIDVNVVGYWRKAAIWLDSTRAYGMPEINPSYPATEGYGSDGISLVRVMTCGGYWGIARLGPLPKSNLLHFGFQYKRAAKFAFSAIPSDGESVTIDTTVYTFRTSAETQTEVTIGATIADTINNLISKWQSKPERLVPYDELTLIPSGNNLEIYSTSSIATALAETGANIAIQTLAGSPAIQTETISDPAPFYDFVSNTTYDDGRNSLNGSDFVVDNCVIYSIEHHSGNPVTLKSVPPDPQNDTCAGSIWIDGLGGSAILHRQFIQNTRIHSTEPYNLKLGFVGRYRQTNCTQDGNLDTSVSYGRTVGSPITSAMLQIIGYDEPGPNFPLDKNRNQVYSDYYLQGLDILARGDIEIGGYAKIGTNNTNSTTGFIEILGGNDANSEVRFSNESTNTIGRIRTSTVGGMTFAVKPSGTGAITDALFISGSNFQVYNAPRPNVDNTISLGIPSLRWSQLYAGTNVINTSDEREKQQIRSLSETEKKVAIKLKSLVKAFKFNNAVGVKGEDARIHVGVIAQEVVSAFQSEGLDANKYGLLCYDEWSEELEEKDSDGNVIQEYRPAGNRYGIRYDQLLAFIISAI